MSQARSSAKLSAVYILYGKLARRGKNREALFDDYLARGHIETVKSLLSDSGEPLVCEYNATDSDLADVLDEVQTPSLWGGKRLVILRGAEMVLSPPAADRARFEGFVGRILAVASAGGTDEHLVLVARALEEAGGRPRTKFKPAADLIEVVRKSGGLLSCVPPYENALKRELIRRAAEAGLRLAPSAADALIQAVGTEQMALQEEIHKLITAAEGREEITRNDVVALSARRSQASVFTLADRILEGDAPGALADLAALRLRPATRSCPFLLAGLAASFRRYLSAARVVACGGSPREAVSSLRVPRFFQDAFVRRLERWTPVSLQALLDRVLQCDEEVKTGAVSDRIALETLVSDACARRLKAPDLVGRWIYEV